MRYYRTIRLKNSAKMQMVVQRMIKEKAVYIQQYNTHMVKQ